MTAEDLAALRAGITRTVGFRIEDVAVFVAALLAVMIKTWVVRTCGARRTSCRFQSLRIHHIPSVAYRD